MGEQMGRNQSIFALEAQILRLPSMLQGCTNEQAFEKHSKSVFFHCLLSVSQMLPRVRQNAAYVEDTIS